MTNELACLFEWSQQALASGSPKYGSPATLKPDDKSLLKVRNADLRRCIGWTGLSRLLTVN